ncbi:PEP/pyruvate-binding domain-containing protein [Streptomyces aureus]
MPLVLDLSSIDATMLETVGGKAANLGELTRAGLPVPQGFCVTTDAYRMISATDGLAGLRPDKARRRILEATVPGELREAIVAAYAELGDDVPVAVRSSATAEDLPFASFAGQQDTYLNVVGAAAVVEAVRHCWASLWTDRAVSYRETNGIDHGSVHLAVVVQRMVASAVSGVMFTANPVTGKRDQVVIDASPGLGEAVVSGAVNPDHFVVEGADGAGGPDGAVGGEIVERSLGDKRFLICPLAGGGTEKVDIGENHAPCLTDRQILELAELGAKVQAHYGSPQDTEWAMDAWGELHLTQSRPITTLFPVPERADGHDDFHVYFCFSLAQGLERPITPAGLAALREIARAAGRTIVGDPRPDGYIESAGRVFIDLTNVLRSRTGRAFFPRVLDVMEARSAQVLRGLYDDPRLSMTHTSPWPAVRRAARLARRFHAPPPRCAPLPTRRRRCGAHGARRRNSCRRPRRSPSRKPCATAWSRCCPRSPRPPWWASRCWRSPASSSVRNLASCRRFSVACRTTSPPRWTSTCGTWRVQSVKTETWYGCSRTTTSRSWRPAIATVSCPRPRSTASAPS